MNNIDCTTILGAIKREFGSLWHCEKKGDTLEIITPYLYPDNSFVSIFVTQRRDKIIVSDGSQLSDFIAGSAGDESLQSASLFRFAKDHGVRDHSRGGIKYYFKECASHKLVPSIAFDMCNFITSVSSASVLTIAQEDSEDRGMFRSKVDPFIARVLPHNKSVQFNRSIPEIKEATFSAVIKSNSQLWLVMYLTGSNLNYFTRSTSNAIVNTQIARASSLKSQIVATIPVLNNEADGYDPTKLAQRIEMLTNVAKCRPINWTEKNEIGKLLAA